MAGVEWPVIGIDLGTTCSCVAVWGNNGVEIIPNELGSRTTPSCVSFTEYDRFIGEAAVNQATMNPLNTIFDAKRLIGRRFSDKSVQHDNEMRPYKVLNGTDPRDTNQLMIPVNYMGEAKKFTPEEITAMTLTKMKGVAEAFTGSTVNSAVISVPAFFNDSQRRATKHAGTIAGFKWTRIINEPTAVALTYYELDMKMNRGKHGKKNVLVFDLGGGTFDVSLVVVEKSKITVKAVRGDTNLGGADFDNRLVREFVTRFKQDHGKDITENPRALGRLRVASEKAKRVLSLLPQADVQIDYLFEGTDFNSTITRARFEELNMDLFEKCIDTVKKCLKEVDIDKMAVDDIVLVGGSTRIPKVQQMLQDLFKGKELCKRVHADEAVAYGAAMQAFYTSAGNNMSKEITVLSDVTPISLGFELESGNMNVIVPKYSPIPITKNDLSCTLCEEQKNGFEFGVYEGEQPHIKYNNLLGSCVLPWPNLPKDANIHVYFNVDEDGLLDVSTAVKLMGKFSPWINMNHQGRLTPEDIYRLISEAGHYKRQDEERRQLLQAKSALESYANTISDQFGDDKNPRTKVLESALELLEQNSELPDISAFKDKLTELQTTFEVSDKTERDHD